MGMQGNRMAPGKGGAPVQRKINPVNTAPGAGDIQTLMDMLSPEGKAILIGLLQQGTFKPLTPPSTPSTPGR